MSDRRDADDRRTTAGEYVLGTLSDEEHDAFTVLLGDDPTLLAEVYAWQDRLLGLTLRSAPVEPGANLWRRIETASAAAPTSGAATVPARWWQRPRAWQGISALALAAALFLAVILVQGGREAPIAGTRYLALLQGPEDRATGWVVEIQAGRTLRLVPVAAAAALPPGRALQFWTKPQGADAPTSLGLVEPGRLLELPVSRLPGVGAEQLFEITLEPQGGSPVGRPTGPILYLGRTLRL